jgi:hypothetical protein
LFKIAGNKLVCEMIATNIIMIYMNFFFIR